MKSVVYSFHIHKLFDSSFGLLLVHVKLKQDKMQQTIIKKQSLISDDERLEMFRLQAEYFSNLNLKNFLHDMSEKDWVIILKNSDSTIAGFSTVEFIRTSFKNKEQLFIFSGDTIVAKESWLSSTLAGGFGHIILRAIKDYPDIPIYWLLITKGFRTYRFLPVFFRKFYPVYNCATPSHVQQLLDQICRYKFGTHFDAATGTIHFGDAKDCLNEEMCQVPEGRKKNPHISFFLEKNPGYIYGNELACLTELAMSNLNRAAHRAILNTEVEWYE